MGRLPQHGLPSGAMSTPGIRPGEPQAAEVKCANLTAEPPAGPDSVQFNRQLLIICWVAVTVPCSEEK